MIETPPRRSTLISLEAARSALLHGLAPVSPTTVGLTDAQGLIAADMPTLSAPLPPETRAEIDGWAVRARDLPGASPYAPLPLATSPTWVEGGQPLPPGCDCVIEPELVERAGTIYSALGEAAPGQGVRRAGEDAAAGRAPVIAGRAVTASDLLLARSAGLKTICVRRPVVRVVDVSAGNEPGLSAQMVRERLNADGAQRLPIEICARDASSIVRAVTRAPAALVILIGGTGNGRSDATATALNDAGALIAHGIALRPGLSGAIGRVADMPVIALPGLPASALGGYLALVEPVVDRLCGRLPRRSIALPLVRKIASAIGLAEIVLVRQVHDGWIPLAVGDLTLDRLREADAWLAVPAGEEGYAPGTAVGAFPLHGWSN